METRAATLVFQAALLIIGAGAGFGFLLQMKDVNVGTCGHFMHVAYSFAGSNPGHYSDPDVNNTTCYP